MIGDFGLPTPVVGWIYNHARKNYWRVAGWYEIDDLIQDGLMKAYQCRRRYGEPGVDVDHPHFMSLVKTAFHRHITELLRHSRGVDDRTKLADLSPDLSESDALDRLVEHDTSPQEFAVLVAELPEWLRKVVWFYMRGDPKRMLKRLRVRLDGSDETSAERLRRLTGFPTDLDFETELRAYLWERDHVDGGRGGDDFITKNSLTRPSYGC